MNYKRKKHPNARAGCAMCKPQKKGNGMNDEKELGHKGFGKLKNLIHAKEDMEGWQSGNAMGC